MIHFGMFLWALLRNKKQVKCYNHCEVRYCGMTSGAVAKGVRMKPWEDYKEEHLGKYFKYKNYWIDVTPEQFEQVYAYLKAAEGTPYEFENFYWHFIKIITGKWKGSKTTRQTYCYEHGLRVLKILGYEVDVFWNPYEFREWADKYLLIKN